MRVLRAFHAGRVTLVFGLIGALALASGCEGGGGGGGGSTSRDESTAKVKHESERDARLKAYGHTGSPLKNKTAKSGSTKK